MVCVSMCSWRTYYRTDPPAHTNDPPPPPTPRPSSLFPRVRSVWQIFAVSLPSGYNTKLKTCHRTPMWTTRWACRCAVHCRCVDPPASTASCASGAPPGEAPHSDEPAQGQEGGYARAIVRQEEDCRDSHQRDKSEEWSVDLCLLHAVADYHALGMLCNSIAIVGALVALVCVRSPTMASLCERWLRDSA